MEPSSPSVMVFVLLILIVAAIVLHCLLRRKQNQGSPQNLTLKLGLDAEGSAIKNAIGQTAYAVIVDGSGRQCCTHCGKGTIVSFVPPTLLDKEKSMFYIRLLWSELT